MNHLELFAGIGGFRRALDLLTQDGIMNFDTIGYSEIDKNAIQTYTLNYDVQGELELGDIVQFTSDVENINALPHFELLTGGFPCQTFSMMGQQAGFQEDRGQMFFRIMDIVDVLHPRYLLLENVKLEMNKKTQTNLAIAKDICSFHNWGLATGFERGEVGDAAKQPTGQSPPQSIIWAQKCVVPKLSNSGGEACGDASSGMFCASGCRDFFP